MCAGCDAYYAWTAAILGTISSVIYLMLSLILVSLKIDDPLDAFAIHFGGGKYSFSILHEFENFRVRILIA